MSSLSDRFDIPMPDGTDDVRDGDDIIRALVDRIDLLLGESGEHLFAAASGSRTTVVNLSRPYPDGFQVHTSLVVATNAGTVETWATGESGTGGPGGVGTFTLGINTSSSLARTVAFRIVPKAP
jgi:hypothetical protein